MKKKRTKLILGAASLCLLGGAYGILRYGNRQAELAAEANQYDTILEVDEQRISSLSFQAGEDTLTFLRDGDSWSLQGDDSFPVDADALSDLLSYLTPLQAVRTLEDITDASDYGFSDPQNEFSIVDEDGGETTVTIGATNDSTGDDYLMLNGNETTIYTVSDNLRSAVSDDLYDYAKSEDLPSLLTNDVTGISLTDSSGRLLYELTLDETSDSWSVTDGDGKEDEGDEETIEDALSSFTSSLYYMSFLEHNCADWAAYGLDEPQTLTVTYRSSSSAASLTSSYGEEESAQAESETEGETETETVTDGERKTEAETEESQDEEFTLTLFIGNTDDTGNYYVRQGASTQVHTISSYALEELLSAQSQDWAAGEEAEAGLEETEPETGEA